MSTKPRNVLQIALAAAVAVSGLFVGNTLPTGGGQSLLSTAEARVGRPLTPVSAAGVARRSTRRAVGAAAVGGAAAYGAARHCYRAVNSNGVAYTRCD